MSLLSIVYPTLPCTTAWPLGGDLAVKAEAGAEREGRVEATPQNTQEWGGSEVPPVLGPHSRLHGSPSIVGAFTVQQHSAASL